jgi:hypothetical protein
MSEKIKNIVSETTQNIGETVQDRAKVLYNFAGRIALSGALELSTGAEKAITAREGEDHQDVVENFDEVIRKKNPNNKTYTDSDLRPVTAKEIRKARRHERLERRRMVKLRQESHLERSYPGVEKVKGTGIKESLSKPDYTGERLSKAEQKTVRKNARKLGRDREYGKWLDWRLDRKVQRPWLSKIQDVGESLENKKEKRDEKLDDAKQKSEQNKERRKNARKQKRDDRKEKKSKKNQEDNS